MTFTEEMTAALDDAHRRIRRIAAGEGPYEGMLVADGESVAVWLDLDTEHPGVDWRFVGAEHVAAPVEIARARSGHGVLLPWSSVRVSAFLSARAHSAVALDAGEWATLVASVLRGLREIVERADAGLPGEWWLSYDGRPLCVPGGERTALSAAQEILQRAGEDCADRVLRRILVGIGEDLTQGIPSAAKAERRETELCEFAAPRALRTEVHAPERARDVSVLAVTDGIHDPARRRHLERRLRDRRGLRDAVDALRERWAQRWTTWTARRASEHPAQRAVPALRRNPARAVRSTPDAVPRRDAAPAHRRRGLALAAAGAAGAVVILGLMIPGGEGQPSGAAESLPSVASDATSASPSADPAADALKAPAEQEQPPEASSDPTDPVSAAQGLLRVLEDCAASDAGDCSALADGATADPAAILSTDVAGEPVLVDDYGDIAVIRLGEGAASQQMLVLIRQDEKWLVRDAYDVADQPSE